MRAVTCAVAGRFILVVIVLAMDAFTAVLGVVLLLPVPLPIVVDGGGGGACRTLTTA